MQFKIKDITIKILQADITKEKVGAIVNAANNQLIMGGGVAGAIKRAGGPSIQEEANRVGPIAIGQAAITGAGELPAKYVIHAAGMGMDFKTDEEKVRLSFRNSLKLTKEKNITSVAFPAIGCGVGGFPVKDCAQIMLDETKKYAQDPTALKEIRFVLFSKKDFDIFVEVMKNYEKV